MRINGSVKKHVILGVRWTLVRLPLPAAGVMMQTKNLKISFFPIDCQIYYHTLCHTSYSHCASLYTTGDDVRDVFDEVFIFRVKYFPLTPTLTLNKR